MSRPLLVELYTEELPPKALKKLGEAFAAGIAAGLKQRGLLDKDDCTVYATPRRLAVLFAAVLDRGADQPIEQKLMPLDVVKKNGTASLEKKLASLGRAHMAALFPDGRDGSDAFVIKKEGKSEFIYLQMLSLGQPLARALDESLQEAVEKLPIPKVMTYQLSDGITTAKFVRPAHGLVALHGSDIVDFTAWDLGLKAGRITHGHRFLGEANIELANAAEYESRLLETGKVVASFDRRRTLIESQLKSKAAEFGASLGDYAGLLDEVTALVEWPVVYVTEFDPAFLEVPQECLILTMRTNQKYFPLFDGAGKLTHRFLIVSNMQVDDPVHIISGNQRVVRPRLEDARFFYNQDRRERLEARVPRLEKVVYHNKLGTQLQRVQRVQLLAGKIARLLQADAAQAERAAWLAKADLVTGMVGEFPELQGVMGRYYAQHDGEPVPVADAIAEHYQPRFAGDRLPEHPVSCAVALADKLETLAGLFGIGQLPTGDRDPFALRRHALGVIRLLVERDLPLKLDALVTDAFSVFAKELKLADAHTDLETFVFERMRGYFAEQGYSTQQIDAVLSLRPVVVHKIPLQLAAVRAFAALPEADSLAAANKRVANILKQAEAKSEAGQDAEAKLLQEPAERALFEALKNASAAATPLFERGDYTGYLKTFAVLKTPVDAFFDGVMVMAEDAALRRNRIALLADLQREMNRIADIAKLAA
ncbi:MAG: glycine--tRNA ligase subunit beta [Burkholderiales bacterium]|jgi:glycyl-tRNA synthetase beta chain|nr:glycine--tRNA ligase subunit beta [Burkholderiales bacterium]